MKLNILISIEDSEVIVDFSTQVEDAYLETSLCVRTPYKYRLEETPREGRRQAGLEMNLKWTLD